MPEDGDEEKVIKIVCDGFFTGFECHDVFQSI